MSSQNPKTQELLRFISGRLTKGTVPQLVSYLYDYYRANCAAGAYGRGRFESELKRAGYRVYLAEGVRSWRTNAAVRQVIPSPKRAVPSPIPG